MRLETNKKVLIGICIVVIIAGALLMVKHNRDKQEIPGTGVVTEQGQEEDQREGPGVVEQQQEGDDDGSEGATREKEDEKKEEVYKGDVVGRTFSGEDTLIEFLDKKRMVITVQAGNGVEETLYQYELGGDRIKMSKDGIEYTYSFERIKDGIKLAGIPYELVGGDER